MLCFDIKNEIRLLDQDLDLKTTKLTLPIWFLQINLQKKARNAPLQLRKPAASWTALGRAPPANSSMM